jgi:diaminopimelate dehydrogenase
VKRHLAIVGFGKLGRACAEAIEADDQTELAGVVRRNPEVELPQPFSNISVVAHITELARVDAALICVPTEQVAGVAEELLRLHIPIVECATFHGEAFEAHFAEIDRLATRQKVPAAVGAGWDPGALSLIRSLFALLTPKGQTDVTWRPGVSLHHTTVAGAIPGVRGALSTELRAGAGKTQRYVYVELDEGVELASVERAIRRDPLHIDEETYVIPVDSVATLEEEGHGVLVERRGRAGRTAHQLLLLEARYSEPALAGVVMVAAARTLQRCSKRAHSLFELPLGAMWGTLRELARKEWI